MELSRTWKAKSVPTSVGKPKVSTVRVTSKVTTYAHADDPDDARTACYRQLAQFPGSHTMQTEEVKREYKGSNKYWYLCTIETKVTLEVEIGSVEEFPDVGEFIGHYS